METLIKKAVNRSDLGQTYFSLCLGQLRIEGSWSRFVLEPGYQFRVCSVRNTSSLIQTTKGLSTLIELESKIVCVLAQELSFLLEKHKKVYCIHYYNISMCVCVCI